jgi:ribosomal protein L11 methyltransferase
VSDRSSERVWAVRQELGSLPAGTSLDITMRKVREEDWADAWKEHFHVERVGRRIVIRPTWRPYTPAPDDVVIDLDPGMAFGTGQHPTTRMCLAALERVVRPGARVVDVGAGSGILAIAAAKLGAASVAALDVDAVAVEVARDNVRMNGVDGVVAVSQGSLEPGPDAMGPADVLVANINAATIIEMAPALARLLPGGGVAVVSGIIAERGDQVVRRLEQEGFHILRRDAEGDWLAVTARRAAPEGTRP